MTVVARVLPRHWDGRRLLRFLTGLAMLALAFTVPAVVEPVPPAPIVVSATAESSVVTDSPVVTERPAPVSLPILVLVAAIFVMAGLIPAGLALRVRAERAPPAV